MEIFEQVMTYVFRFLQDTNFVIVLYELLISFFLLKKRSKIYLRLLVFVPFIVLTNNSIGIVNYYADFFLIGGIQFGYLLFFFVSVFLVWFCFDEKFLHILYFSTAAYIIENMGSQIGNILNLAFFNGTVVVKDYNDVRPFFYYCIRELVEVPIFILVRFVLIDRYKKSFDFRVKISSVITLETVTLLIIVILNWVGTMFGYMNLIARVYAMIVDIMLLLFQFAVFSQRKTEYEKDITEEILRIQAKQQEQTKESNALINIKYHDLKREIAALKLVGDKDDKAEAIRGLEQATSLFESAVKSGNESLDVILTEKFLLCKKNDVHFSFLVDGKLLNFMSASDIYVLFSNALDNAFEGVLKSEKDLREIQLLIERKEEFVKITLKNRCEGKINFEDGMPITSKDKSYHGYGTKSIRLIVDKYKGILNMQQEGNEFILKILIPIKGGK